MLLVFLLYFFYLFIVGGCSHMIMIVQELFALSRVRRRPTNLFQVSAEKETMRREEVEILVDHEIFDERREWP